LADTGASALRVGLVGAGTVVRLAHLPALAAVEDTSPVAIADATLERAQELGADLGLTAYADFEEMFTNADLDAVCIALPNHLHRRAVEAAAQAGLHVFCEKPLAHTLVDAIAIVEACARAGTLLQTGFNQRFWSPVQMAKRALDAGVVGEVHMFRSVLADSYQVYPAASGYRYDLAQSGGASILDLAIHRIDLARYLVGDIIEVCATVDHSHIPFAADDNVHLLCRFANGATGVISSNRYSAQVSNATDLYGPVGTIHLSTETINPYQSVPLAVSSTLPLADLPIELAQADWPEAWWNDYQPGTWLRVTPPRTNPYESEWAAFARAVRTETTPSPSGLDGVRAQEVVTAAHRSVRTHRWVTLPLDDPEEPIPTYS